MYDPSKMISLEESSKGYTTCLTIPGGRVIEVSFLPFSDKEDKTLTNFKARNNAQELLNGILDILSDATGKYIPGTLVKTIKVG